MFFSFLLFTAFDFDARWGVLSLLYSTPPFSAAPQPYMKHRLDWTGPFLMILFGDASERADWETADTDTDTQRRMKGKER